MDKSKWVWMPHPAHFICGDRCRFHLSTYVGGYIVSTIGEMWSDSRVRRLLASTEDPNWYRSNEQLKGDVYDSAHMKRFGFEEIGCDRKYETMVFRAKKNTEKCGCQFVIESGDNLDFIGHNDAESARDGHFKMCRKWSGKKAKRGKGK